MKTVKLIQKHKTTKFNHLPNIMQNIRTKLLKFIKLWQFEFSHFYIKKYVFLASDNFTE